jgi:hypothetical protein
MGSGKPLAGSAAGREGVARGVAAAGSFDGFTLEGGAVGFDTAVVPSFPPGRRRKRNTASPTAIKPAAKAKTRTGGLRVMVTLLLSAKAWGRFTGNEKGAVARALSCADAIALLTGRRR